MASISIYPNFEGCVGTPTATHHARLFNLMQDSGLAPSPYTLEGYLAQHATEQTIERVTELTIQANVVVIGTDLVGYQVAIIIVQGASSVDIGGCWLDDPTGFVDNLASEFNDPWAADVLATRPMHYVETIASSSQKVLQASLSANLKVQKAQWDNGGFTSWPSVGELMNTFVLLMVHKGTTPMAISQTIGINGCMHIRKSITYNNDTLLGGVY